MKYLVQTKISFQKQYWNGPFDVKIPISIKSVINQDGKTYYHQDRTICVSELKENSLTETEYKKKYAEFKEGIWFWKIEH
ncbi:Hypothetical protein KVN_LOCUS19 [uncultured virus]|nr:Hypothetical protein KVN_LOCUS19 [uncultured virus]